MLSFVSHEGSNDFQLQFLLEPELFCHGDIPIHTGLAGQFPQEHRERVRVVESVQLVDLSQVAVYSAPASVELLELNSLGGGGFGMLIGVEVGNSFDRKLAGLPVLVIEELPDLLHFLHPFDLGPDIIWHAVPDGTSLL